MCYKCEDTLLYQNSFLKYDIFKDIKCSQIHNMQTIWCASECYTGLNIEYDSLQPTDDVESFTANMVNFLKYNL